MRNSPRWESQFRQKTTCTSAHVSLTPVVLAEGTTFGLVVWSIEQANLAVTGIHRKRGRSAAVEVQCRRRAELHHELGRLRQRNAAAQRASLDGHDPQHIVCLGKANQGTRVWTEKVGRIVVSEGQRCCRTLPGVAARYRSIRQRNLIKRRDPDRVARDGKAGVKGKMRVASRRLVRKRRQQLPAADLEAAKRCRFTFRVRTAIREEVGVERYLAAGPLQERCRKLGVEGSPAVFRRGFEGQSRCGQPNANGVSRGGNRAAGHRTRDLNRLGRDPDEELDQTG